MRKIHLLFLLVFTIQSARACLICIIKDDQQVLVGNHEDWYAEDAEIRFVPIGSQSNHYGYMGFGFASEGWAQGGMNTEGLFFDGTATPVSPIDQTQKEQFPGYIYEAILGNCSNIKEVAQYVKRYQLPGIEEVHLMFADGSGDWLIIGVYEGQLQFHYNEDSFEVLTNFNLTDPEYGDEPVCMRNTLATSVLEEEQEATIEAVETALEHTIQEDLTIYSNIYNLVTKEVHVYYKGDLSRSITFDLLKELEKGKQSYLLEELF